MPRTRDRKALPSASAVRSTTITSSARTAASAPTGSFRIASHWSSAAERRERRAERRSGAITVGPVTIMMPPKTAELSQLRPAP